MLMHEIRVFELQIEKNPCSYDSELSRPEKSLNL